MAKSQGLEENFENLEIIVSKLETGNLPIEEAFKLYNDGIKLVANCNKQLDKVEKQIMILSGEDNDGI